LLEISPKRRRQNFSAELKSEAIQQGVVLMEITAPIWMGSGWQAEEFAGLAAQSVFVAFSSESCLEFKTEVLWLDLVIRTFRGVLPARQALPAGAESSHPTGLKAFMSESGLCVR